jgi:excinuclease UvrABC nuclease subunit
MSVVDIIQEQDEMKAHCCDFVLWPRQWRTYDGEHDWTMYKLTRPGRGNIPDQPGIYTLLIQPGIANHSACSYLMYVGQTNSLYRRFGEYLSERKRETGRPKILRLLNKYSDNVWFCFTIAPEDALDTIEENLINAYLPPANDQLPAEVSRVMRAF